MLWVLQSNLYNEEGYHNLVEILTRLDIPFLMVKPVPFTDRLVRADANTATGVDLDSLPEPDIDTNQCIMVSGSYTLAKIAHARGWKPGAFLDNLSYDVWSKAWAPELLLNPDAKICKVADADFEEELAFLRPVEDSKVFAGKLFDREEFRTWKKVLCGMQPQDPLNGDTQIIIAKPVKIYTETRLFVVDGKIVAHSGYKLGNKVIYSSIVDDRILDFGRHCIGLWQPNQAFVLDIADTEYGLKIVELNCFNAAGLYAANVQNIVIAMEELATKNQ